MSHREGEGGGIGHLKFVRRLYAATAAIKKIVEQTGLGAITFTPKPGVSVHVTARTVFHCGGTVQDSVNMVIQG